MDVLKMYCECCGEEFPRWEMEIVQPEHKIFALNELVKKKEGVLPEFNFACPSCVTKYSLRPYQSVNASSFREKNEKFRRRFEPQTVH